VREARRRPLRRGRERGGSVDRSLARTYDACSIRWTREAARATGVGD